MAHKVSAIGQNPAVDLTLSMELPRCRKLERETYRNARSNMLGTRLIPYSDKPGRARTTDAWCLGTDTDAGGTSRIIESDAISS